MTDRKRRGVTEARKGPARILGNGLNTSPDGRDQAEAPELVGKRRGSGRQIECGVLELTTSGEITVEAREALGLACIGRDSI